MIDKTDEYGVGIVTKQNATKDVSGGGQYMNVKKIKISKGKSKGYFENFADGKGPGKLVRNAKTWYSQGATMAQLQKAPAVSGRKGQLARWQINMQGPRKANDNSTDKRWQVRVDEEGKFIGLIQSICMVNTL